MYVPVDAEPKGSAQYVRFLQYLCSSMPKGSRYIYKIYLGQKNPYIATPVRPKYIP